MLIKAVGLAVIFAAVSFYYASHSVEKIKEAVTIYRNGPDDSRKR